MHSEHVKAYSFLLSQYVHRGDRLLPFNTVEKGGERIVLYEYDNKPESERFSMLGVWYDCDDSRSPSDMLREMATGTFTYNSASFSFRSAAAVFPVGEDRRREHTFAWIELHEDAFPGRRPGQEACVIDFSQDLKVIQKEIEALWRRERYIIEDVPYDGVCPNAAERYLCSGLKSCSVTSTRLTGLWLWDHVHEQGARNSRGAVAQAIRDFCDGRFDRAALGLEEKMDSDFRDYYRWTDQSILAYEVLPFSKR